MLRQFPKCIPCKYDIVAIHYDIVLAVFPALERSRRGYTSISGSATHKRSISGLPVSGLTLIILSISTISRTWRTSCRTVCCTSRRAAPSRAFCHTTDCCSIYFILRCGSPESSVQCHILVLVISAKCPCKYLAEFLICYGHLRYTLSRPVHRNIRNIAILCITLLT